MINIKNIIIEKFDEYDVNLKDSWFGIYGGFEMKINDKIFGYYPEEDEFIPGALTEDILYWFAELATCVMELSKNGKYTLQLLPHTMGKIVFLLKDEFVIEYYNQNSILQWKENCDWQQFMEELYRNLEGFICNVWKENIRLLEVKEFIEIKTALELLKNNILMYKDF